MTAVGPLFSVPVLLYLVIPTAAQEPTPTEHTVLKSKQFSYTEVGGLTELKQDRFCLPRDEQLIKVVKAYTTNSNADSFVDVNGDATSNCIDLSVTLPPAKQVCISIPDPSLLQPGKTKQLCNTIPTVLTIVVDYESQISPPK